MKEINYNTKSFEIKTKKTVFAARNGHHGFSSMFGKIFTPSEYTKIFILKGGPGTGKSTIMRSIFNALSEKGCITQQILCSSDPESLDGVIAGLGDYRCAVIDGTAPHATDPTLPGAVEEIIDLGISFDTGKLIEHRSELYELASAKAKNYRSAYSLLSSAGKIQSNICEILSENNAYNAADYIAANIISQLKIKPKDEQKSLRSIEQTSAFCREGYIRLPIEATGKKIVNITASRFEAATVIGALHRKLDGMNAVTCICPSALDENILDRFETENFIFCSNEEDNCDISYPCDIPVETICSADRESYVSLCSMYEKLLDLASNLLRFASDLHFKMEQIYKSAVDFSIIDRISYELLKKLESILLQQ